MCSVTVPSPTSKVLIGSNEDAPGSLGGGQAAVGLERRALWTPGPAPVGPPMSLVRQKDLDPHLKGSSRHLTSPSAGAFQRRTNLRQL